MNNKNVGSIVWGGYPGQDGGYALIDILVGKQAPAGRLTTTQYPADYINEVSLFDPYLRPSSTNPGRTYKWYTGQAVRPFGFGLHYTTFKPSWGTTPHKNIAIASLVHGRSPGSYGGGKSSLNDASAWMTVTVNVKNTGKICSDYVGLLFLETKEAGPAPYPNKWLGSYARLRAVQPGQTQTVKLNLNLGALARANEAGDLVIYPGDYSLLFDYDSSLTFDFKLTGQAVTIDSLPKQQAQYNFTVPVHIQQGNGPLH